MGSDQAMVLIFIRYLSRNRFFRSLKLNFRPQNCPYKQQMAPSMGLREHINPFLYPDADHHHGKGSQKTPSKSILTPPLSCVI